MSVLRADCLEDHTDDGLNDWSFSQLCQLAGVSKDTLNRLSTGETVRSIHGTAYTRL